jgi:hypothetical protein
VLCNLAVGAMELMEEEHPGLFTWSTLDVTTKAGVKRLRRIRPVAGRQIPVPSILVDGQILFDHIPDLEDLDDWFTANLASHGCSDDGR